MSIDENGKEIFGDNGMIRCTQCGIRTRETKECDVIEAWNRRVDNGFYGKGVKQKATD